METYEVRRAKAVKENYKRLNKIFSLTPLKPEMFYFIGIEADHVKMLGDSTSKLHLFCAKLKNAKVDNTENLITYRKNNVRIILDTTR